MPQLIGVILIGIAIVAWINQHPIDVPRSVAVQQAASVAVATTDQFDETGMVVFEDTGDNPGVPWIVYQGPNRPVATKQLVFDNVSRCDAGARELPCASDTREGAYPVAAEQRVRIQGIVDGEKVYVQRLTYL